MSASTTTTCRSGADGCSDSCSVKSSIFIQVTLKSTSSCVSPLAKQSSPASPPTEIYARSREGAQKESLSHDSFLRDLGHKRGGLGRIFGRVKNDNSTSKSGQNYIYWFEPATQPVRNHAFFPWWFHHRFSIKQQKSWWFATGSLTGSNQ